MPKPKIIVCATAYHPFVGGAEIAVQEVAQRLSAQFDFLVLTARMSRALPRREMRPEATIIRLGIGSRFDKWFLPLLIPWHLRSKSPSPIRSGTSSKFLLWGMDISQGSLGAVAAKLLFPRVPFVLTVQYGESEAYLGRGRLGMIGFCFRRMLAAADVVTGISVYLLDIARAYGYVGPAALIHNGVDVKKFQRTNDKLQINPKDEIKKSKTVITVSRLAPKNGVDVLIRAIARVRKEIPDIQCSIAGDGPERDNLEALAAALGIPDAISFLGTVPHAELARYLHKAAVFVRPSRSEGMGNAFVEAAAAGVPIIGTRVGGISDIIEDGKTGLFAAIDDPADCAEKILRLMRDSAYAEMLAHNGEEKIANQFDWDKIADEYRRVFESEIAAEKRVTIAAGLFPPDIGGPATYSHALVAALPERGIGVRVSYFGAVRHLPRIVRHAAYFLRLIFAARGSDVIFAQDTVSTGLSAVFAAKLLGKKFFLKVVGDYAWEQERQKISISNDQFLNFETLEDFQNHRHRLVTEARRAIQKFVARAADRVIVPSEYLAGIVRGWGVREGKISVVYNAVAAPNPRVQRDEARKRLGLSGIVVISVGRLVPWKGFFALIDAVADLAADVPDVRLVIAGSGPEERNLRRHIRERGVGDRVRMTGALSHEALREYFAGSDVFVLNSGYEGLSHTLIEAMAAGLPVIATRVGGNPEVITDGAEGILVAYNDKKGLKDALVRLAGDPDMRAAFAARALARAAQFTKEKMIRETAAILKSL